MNWLREFHDDEVYERKLKSLRIERYRQQARRNMKSIKEVLLNAAYHTQAVMARAHVEPGHSNMIGQFINSLKTELNGHPLKAKFSSLVLKDAWDDILVPSSYSRGLDPEFLSQIKEAYADYHYNYDAFSGVARRLDAMKDSPDSLMSHVKAMRDLNVQAEHIMNSLCELADTIED